MGRRGLLEKKGLVLVGDEGESCSGGVVFFYQEEKRRSPRSCVEWSSVMVFLLYIEGRGVLIVYLLLYFSNSSSRGTS